MAGRCIAVVIVGLGLALTLPALAQDKKADADPVLDGLIKQAVDKGVAFLRKHTVAGPAAPSSSGSHYASGGQALTGWTLLECGVPSGDPLIQKLADTVRNGIIDQEAYFGTYNLSTALIFLDKLGDPADAPLIESMTVRLLMAQSEKHGGWGYPAPFLTPAERARLKAVLKERRETRAQGKPLNDPKRTPEDKLRDMRRYAGKLIDQYGGDNRILHNDNSNTQFAMMALWVARRHDLPVGAALVNVGKRFRQSQEHDGAWKYSPDPVPGGQALGDPYKHPAMTCAGLLGLALEKGAQNRTKDDLDKDAVAQKGFAYLGRYLARLEGDAGPFPNALRGGAPAAANPVAPRRIDRGGNYYYFLFSLERMAVVYDTKKLGAIDWYAWGAEDLVNHQAANGSWTAQFTDWNADTCFALLFLKRANVARDLTHDFNRRPGAKTPPKNDPLLDLPLILPKEEKRKAAPPAKPVKPAPPAKPSSLHVGDVSSTGLRPRLALLPRASDASTPRFPPALAASFTVEDHAGPRNLL